MTQHYSRLQATDKPFNRERGMSIQICVFEPTRYERAHNKYPYLRWIGPNSEVRIIKPGKTE